MAPLEIHGPFLEMMGGFCQIRAGSVMGFTIKQPEMGPGHLRGDGQALCSSGDSVQRVGVPTKRPLSKADT